MTLKYLVRLNSQFSGLNRLLHCVKVVSRVTTHLEDLESQKILWGLISVRHRPTPPIHVVSNHVATDKLTCRTGCKSHNFH